MMRDERTARVEAGKPSSQESPVYYSMAGMPSGLELLDELDLNIKWETDRGNENPDDIRDGRPVDELNQLFQRRVRDLILEKKASCAHVKRERITRSTNYAHGTCVMQGEYVIELYGPVSI